MKVCNKCDYELDDENFYFSKGRLVNPCITCRKLLITEWRKNNPEKVKQQKQRYDIKHADEKRKRNQEWIERNRERYDTYHKRWLIENRDKTRNYVKSQTDKVRDQILDHYGHFCNNCGIDDDDVLVVDHVNNDGAQHRKEKRGKYSQYKSIIDAGFPSDYQILCCNCNWKKHVNGGIL